jgi:hypothetical protein
MPDLMLNYLHYFPSWPGRLSLHLAGQLLGQQFHFARNTAILEG